jgi:Kef-type K+ transport system membrane component KefB/predicted transcriptional regulator
MQLNLILIIGLAVFVGMIGARVFQRLRIPQVVGYVAIGFLLGPVLRIITSDVIKSLEPFNLFALGMIGFLVGGELKQEVFVRFGKQVPIVLLFEGVTAFVLVGVLSFVVVWHFAGWRTALAVGVVFGAICSATDPASTIAVLWEYKAKGPLTSMLTAIVTLDDALALVLYALSIGIAGVATGHHETGLLSALGRAMYELTGSIVLGLIAGAAISRILRRFGSPEMVLIVSVSSLLLVIGLAIGLKVDTILTCMTLGLVLTNVKSKRIQASFDAMHNFFTPMYVLFFVLVGGRVNVSYLDAKIAALVAAYVVGSLVGKTLGAYLGGVFSGAVKSIRRYLGFCLYPQGGIAVGLLIMASHRFKPDIASVMLLVVIIGAFLLQIIGPIGVKIGAGKAGELGLNITEEDLIRTYTVKDVMDIEVPVISAGMELDELIKVVSETNYFFYPVVDNDKKLIGVVTLDGIRNTFSTQQLTQWLVALDLAEDIVTKVTPQIPLADALATARKLYLQHIPVISSQQENIFVGVLDLQAVRRALSAKVLSRQQKADTMGHIEAT